jgi:hypothetical protein
VPGRHFSRLLCALLPRLEHLSAVITRCSSLSKAYIMPAPHHTSDLPAPHNESAAAC